MKKFYSTLPLLDASFRFFYVPQHFSDKIIKKHRYTAKLRVLKKCFTPEIKVWVNLLNKSETTNCFRNENYFVLAFITPRHAFMNSKVERTKISWLKLIFSSEYISTMVVFEKKIVTVANNLKKQTHFNKKISSSPQTFEYKEIWKLIWQHR